jgi:drug/metabolite transporter (DMT)-like permease
MFAGTSLMWGASFYWLAIAIPDFGWAGTVAFRSFIASGLLLLIASVQRRALDFQGEWRNMAVLGFTSVALNLGGMNFALTRLDSSVTAILVSTIPLYSVIIEWMWHRKRPSATVLIGLIVGFTGVAILIGFTPQRIDGRFMLGFLGSAIGSAGFAFGGSWAKAHMPHMGYYEQTIGNFFFGGLFTLPLIAVVPLAVVPPTWHAIAALVIVAASASSFAYILYFKLVDEIGATRALTTEFMVPVVAVIMGVVLLHEHITVVQLVGALVIFVGCSLVLGLFSRKHPPLQDVVAH